MRDILPFVDSALDRGQRVGWARVVATWGSAPRRPGAALAVVSPSEYAGSVSGGCVEDAVIDEALGSLASGSVQVVDYGVSDEVAWSAGLSCGGTVRILVEPFPSGSCGRSLVEAVRQDRAVVLATSLDGEGEALFDRTGNLLDGRDPPPGIAEATLPTLGDRTPRLLELGSGRWFVHPFSPRERLVIVGGADIAARLLPLARSLAFETILVDPRGVFSSGRALDEGPDRFEHRPAEDVLRELGPDANTYVVLLTHDPAVDDPALDVLLRSDAAYVGALGGRKTQEKRRTRLLEAGLDPEAVDRIDGPVGVPIGAVTPAEIAVSIAGRLVEVRHRSR